jgi:hypothetical protein
MWASQRRHEVDLRRELVLSVSQSGQGARVVGEFLDAVGLRC